MTHRRLAGHRLASGGQLNGRAGALDPEPAGGDELVVGLLETVSEPEVVVEPDADAGSDAVADPEPVSEPDAVVEPVPLQNRFPAELPKS